MKMHHLIRSLYRNTSATGPICSSWVMLMIFRFSAPDLRDSLMSIYLISFPTSSIQIVSTRFTSCPTQLIKNQRLGHSPYAMALNRDKSTTGRLSHVMRYHTMR